MGFEGWRLKKIVDTDIEILDGDRGKNYPNNKELLPKGHTLFLSNKNLHDDKLSVSFGEYISKEKDELLRKGKLVRNDIVMSTRGSVGNIGYFHEGISVDNIRINSGMVIFRNNDKGLLNDYLYHLLKSPYCKNQYIELTSGSVQNQLPIRDLKNLKLLIPSLKEQREIVFILKSLESKVENNDATIASLEQLAQTLFKHWFVDFEFPNENGEPYKSSGGEMVESELGMIPKGWGVKSLDEIADFQNGLAMQKFRPKDREESLPVLKIKELRQGRTGINSDRCSINIRDAVKVFDGDVIFSWSATLLVTLWHGGNAGLNQHLFKVTSKDFPKWFYYYWIKEHLQRFVAIASDKATTMGHINRSHLSESKVVTPTQEQINMFSKYFNPIIDNIIVNGLETSGLEELRDTLLPKLLTGEIQLKDDIEGVI